MARSKDRPKQAHYARLPLLAVCLIQVVSSVIVAGILYYFFFGLHRKQLFFICLSAAAHFSFLQLVTINVVSCFSHIPPLLRLISNTISFALWCVGFGGLVSYDLKWKLFSQCTGHMICTLYKVLIAFTAASVAASVLAVLLDISVLRRAQWGYKHINKNETTEGMYGISSNT